MNDTRAAARRASLEQGAYARARPVRFFGAMAIALGGALIPSYEGLSSAGVWTLFILLFGAGLWITEAIPAFAVALLVIGLEIAILGRPGGVFAENSGDWTIFVEPWASPIIWLFFGGFVLAEAASKTGLDRWVSRWVLERCGGGPKGVMLGVMGMTFIFSMFISNSATAAMMMAILAPIVATLEPGERFRKGLLPAVPVAANLGGMGTIIGSPPNAIAVGALTGAESVGFAEWMWIGLPPAILLMALSAVALWRFYRPEFHALKIEFPVSDQTDGRPLWPRLITMGAFCITVVLWLTGPLHGIPTPVVSFFPIIVLTVSGILGADDIRRLHWDILLLLTGGLALGVAVEETGLAIWLLDHAPIDGLSPVFVALALAYCCSVLSNFMSNTAAANIMIPIAAALSSSDAVLYVAPVALAASSAMCLPVSTPPNAIAYSSGELNSRDFLRIGVLVGVLSPLAVTIWLRVY